MKKYLKFLDHETYYHSVRVMNLTELFSYYLRLNQKQIDILKKGALYHDIGKIFIDKSILLKPTKLTDAEYEIIKTHPLKGYEMLYKEINNKEVLYIILEHHERVDGKGYPFNKRSNEISFYSKIVNIVDSYDAMTTRTYNQPKTIQEALIELNKNTNKQFDEELVNLFKMFIIKHYRKDAV